MSTEFEIDPLFSTSLVFYSAGVSSQYAAGEYWRRASIVVAEIRPDIDGLVVRLSPGCFACGPGPVTADTRILNSSTVLLACDESIRLVAWKDKNTDLWSRLRFSLQDEFLEFLWLMLDAKHRPSDATLVFDEEFAMLVQQYDTLLLRVARPSFPT
ncbi:hypothetical protein FKP32DRAFT_1682251 [Trametes sanguinea]|nr:hypothetical protein FKP32DRAFT_1682251 [Trametes sanguinea]